MEEPTKSTTQSNSPFRTSGARTNDLLREQANHAKAWRAQDVAQLAAATAQARKALFMSYFAGFVGVAALALSLWQAVKK